MNRGCVLGWKTRGADSWCCGLLSFSHWIWWDLHSLRRTKNNTEGFSSAREMFFHLALARAKLKTTVRSSAPQGSDAIKCHPMQWPSVAQNTEAALKNGETSLIYKKRKRRKKNGWQYKVFRETKHAFIKDWKVSEGDKWSRGSKESSKTNTFLPSLLLSTLFFPAFYRY